MDKEAKLLRTYQPLLGYADVETREDARVSLPIIAEPCVVLDVHGRIIGWSLPSAVGKSRQVSIRYDIQ